MRRRSSKIREPRVLISAKNRARCDGYRYGLGLGPFVGYTNGALCASWLVGEYRGLRERYPDEQPAGAQ